MQACSLNLRQRVAAAYEKRIETILEVAECFAVSDGFIKNCRAENAQAALAKSKINTAIEVLNAIQ